MTDEGITQEDLNGEQVVRLTSGIEITNRLAPALSESLARPFQLHQEGGHILHGAQFPSGHVALEVDDACVYRMSLGHLLETYPGVAIWPEDLLRMQQP